jgi:hypothetical protein
MKNIIVVIIFVLTLTSCTTTRRLNKLVYQYHIENPVGEIKEPKWLENSSKTIETFSTSEKVKSRFIPAIFYWKWDTKIYTEINKDIILNRFVNYLSSKSDSLSFSEKLNEQKLKIDNLEAPNKFTYSQDGKLLDFILLYSLTDSLTIKPYESPYRLKYSIIDTETNTVKKVEVEVESRLPAMTNESKSKKIFIQRYLEEYYKNQDKAFEELIKKMGKDILSAD